MGHHIKNNARIVLKVLELLSAGFLLALEKNKTRRRGLHNECDKIWHEIDRKQLYQVLDRLRMRSLLKSIQTANDTESIVLTSKGKSEFLKYTFQNLRITPLKKWDQKWRLAMFDIPESKRLIRDALRRKLKALGFLEFQKSVFVYPYPCGVEINFVINTLGVPQNVYYIESTITPDNNLRKHFKLNF